NDFLKNICQVEHSRHRSPVNFLVNLLAALSAYSFLPSKPSIRGSQDEGVLPLLV
ncbi:MAG: IS982 family transposase, partial [Spirochaetaceae bacterium]|nr:IS982 family transposase [Spirochaetaceae bacterium]